MKIWIVEDNTPTRMLMRTLVNSAAPGKYDCSDFSSAEDVIKALQEGTRSKPQVYLVDLNLPGMSGFDLCQQIRMHYSDGSDFLPYIIICTADSSSEVLTQLLGAGANDYFVKPVHAKMLQIRLQVAEQLITQAQYKAATQASSEYLNSLVTYAVTNAPVPMAVVEIGTADKPLQLAFANTGMQHLFYSEAHAGTSLAELQSWNAEFTSGVWISLSRGEQVFQGPLVTDSPELNSFNLNLSIYPVATEESSPTHYLVIEEARV